MSDKEEYIIKKVKKTFTEDGYNVLSHEELYIQGDNLNECRKHFNELWYDDDDDIRKHTTIPKKIIPIETYLG